MLKLDFSKEWGDSDISVNPIDKTLTIPEIQFQACYYFGDSYLHGKCFICMATKTRNEHFNTESEALSWCEEQATARLEAVQKFIEDRRIK